MVHKGTKTIETERLILRKFTNEDAKAAFHNWTSDDKVTEYLRWPTHTDLSVTERVIKDWVTKSEKDDFYQWAIELKELNEPIGTISVVDRNDSLNILLIKGRVDESIQIIKRGAIAPFVLCATAPLRLNIYSSSNAPV